jgi:hypothetical protein
MIAERKDSVSHFLSAQTEPGTPWTTPSPLSLPLSIVFLFLLVEAPLTITGLFKLGI